MWWQVCMRQQSNCIEKQRKRITKIIRIDKEVKKYLWPFSKVKKDDQWGSATQKSSIFASILHSNQSHGEFLSYHDHHWLLCHGPGPPLALGSLGDLLRTHPLPIFVPAQWGKKTGDRRFVPVCVIVYLRLIDRHCLIFPLFQFCCSQFSSFFLSSNCGWMKNCCWWWEDSTPSSSCPSPSASSSPTCWSNNHSCPGWKENYSWEF